MVNELLARPQGSGHDWIELHNTTDQAIDIGGWFLSDDFVKTNADGGYSLKKYQIPANTVIPAGGFKVFYEADFRFSNPAVPFALTEYGETVYLSAANADGDLLGYIVGASFGASDNGVSWGRYETSRDIDFVPLSKTTFGVDSPATVAEFPAMLRHGEMADAGVDSGPPAPRDN